MNRLHQDYAGQGLDVIAISSEEMTVIKKFVADAGVEYPTYRDANGDVAAAFGVGGIPAAFLLRDDGTILWQGHPGESATLKAAIEANL